MSAFWAWIVRTVAEAPDAGVCAGRGLPRPAVEPLERVAESACVLPPAGPNELPLVL